MTQMSNLTKELTTLAAVAATVNIFEVMKHSFGLDWIQVFEMKS